MILINGGIQPLELKQLLSKLFLTYIQYIFYTFNQLVFLCLGHGSFGASKLGFPNTGLEST